MALVHTEVGDYYRRMERGPEFEPRDLSSSVDCSLPLSLSWALISSPVEGRHRQCLQRAYRVVLACLKTKAIKTQNHTDLWNHALVCALRSSERRASWPSRIGQNPKPRHFLVTGCLPFPLLSFHETNIFPHSLFCTICIPRMKSLAKFSHYLWGIAWIMTQQSTVEQSKNKTLTSPFMPCSPLNRGPLTLDRAAQLKESVSASEIGCELKAHFQARRHLRFPEQALSASQSVPTQRYTRNNYERLWRCRMQIAWTLLNWYIFLHDNCYILYKLDK